MNVKLPLVLVPLLVVTACGAPVESESGFESAGSLGDVIPEGEDDPAADEDPTDGETPCFSDADCQSGDVCVEGVCWADTTCFTQTTKTLTAPNVALVLDKSGSMIYNSWDHDNDESTPEETRWKTLHGVVTDLADRYDNTMNVGAQLFPSTQATKNPSDADSCHVNNTPEVSIAPGNAAAVLAGIPAADDESLEGGTPAERGVDSAYRHLASMSTPNESGVTPDSYIILITDGYANCNADADDPDSRQAYDPQLVQTIESAFENNVATFVIGIDISDEENSVGINPFNVLNDAALAGGMPRENASEQFYNTVNRNELNAALDAVTAELLSCTIPLETWEYAYSSLRSVERDGVKYSSPLPEGFDCATTPGWRFTDASETEIELCGTLCDEYQTQGGVTLNFDCFEE